MEATMSTTPYSDQWRKQTNRLMRDAGVDSEALWEATGLDIVDMTRALAMRDHEVSLEIAGPIDEHLARIVASREAVAIAEECIAHHPGAGSIRVRRVDVDLGPLADCGVEFTATPYVPLAADSRVNAARERRGVAGPGDERRRWR
jgi:hypothetical protein